MDMTMVGERLRARRRELDLTLAAVSESAGLSLPYVANLERGRGNPTLEVLSRLAEALQLPVGEIVHDAGREASGVDATLASLPPSLQKFSRSARFRTEISELAQAQDVPVTDMRRRVLGAMAAAPRRSKGEPTDADWIRLLDTFVIILR